MRTNDVAIMARDRERQLPAVSACLVAQSGVLSPDQRQISWCSGFGPVLEAYLGISGAGVRGWNSTPTARRASHRLVFMDSFVFVVEVVVRKVVHSASKY
jgi:hypothetical protein